mgnify:CR=1 FL=1
MTPREATLTHTASSGEVMTLTVREGEHESDFWHATVSFDARFLADAKPVGAIERVVSGWVGEAAFFAGFPERETVDGLVTERWAFSGAGE